MCVVFPSSMNFPSFFPLFFSGLLLFLAFAWGVLFFSWAVPFPGAADAFLRDLARGWMGYALCDCDLLIVDVVVVGG